MNTTHPHRHARVAVLLPILALLAAAGAALAAPASAAKACKPGSIRATVMGKSTCMKVATLRARVPKGSKAAIERRAIKLIDSPAFRRKLGGDTRYVPRLTARNAKARARVAALARAAALKPPTGNKTPSEAAAARRLAAIDTMVEPLTKLPGWTGQTTTRSFERSDAVSDFGARTETVAERTANGTKTRLVRQYTSGGTIDRCPDRTGTVRGTWIWGLGDTVSTVDARGNGGEQGALQESTGTITIHVGDDAQITTYDIDIVHTLRVTGREIQGGKSRHIPTRSYRGRVLFEGLEPGKPDALAIFTPGHVKQLGVWGPKGRVPLDAQDAAWQSFLHLVGIILGDIQEPMTIVQRNWDRHAECLEAEFTPGGRSTATLPEMREGSSQALKVRVLDMAGAEVAIADAAARTNDYLRVDTATLAIPGGVTITTLKAGKEGHLAIEGVSRRGRVRGYVDVPIVPKQPQAIMYRVLSASFKESTVASDRTEATGTCQVAGLPIGGKAVFLGSSDTLAEAEGSLMPRNDGSWKGIMATRMPARKTGVELTGCTHASPGNLVACTVTLPDIIPQPHGTWGIGIYMEIPAGAATGKLTLKASNPGVGFLDPDDDVCNVWPVEQNVPDADRTVEIETSKLLGTEPFTVNITGGKHWDQDNAGYDAKIDFTWEYWITLQRIP